MRETDKNNLPIPVCFFFQLESHGRPQTVRLTYHMFKDVFVWHPFWKVSEFLDRLMEKTLWQQNWTHDKVQLRKTKKHVPWKSMVAFFFDWNCPFFWGNRKPLFFFCVWGCIPWSLKFLSQKACWKRKKLNGWTMTFLRVAGVVEGAVLTPPGERGKSTQSSIVAAECTWFCQTNLWQLCYASIEEVVS